MHGDIKEIVVSADSVWTPDIVLTNSLSDGFDAKFRSLVTITHKGEALWLPPAMLNSICEVDPTYFPFDTQSCRLRFMSWNYNKDKIDIYHEKPLNELEGHGSKG